MEHNGSAATGKTTDKEKDEAFQALDQQYPENTVLKHAYEKSFVFVWEHGKDSPAANTKKMIKNKTVRAILAEEMVKNHFTGRTFTILWIDVYDTTVSAPWAGGAASKLSEDVELKDPVPTTGPWFCLQFTSPLSVFSHTLFLRKKHDDYEFKAIPDFLLYLPQTNCLLQFRRALVLAEGGLVFLAILPTGSGKTILIALSPFMLDIGTVLVILPDLSIRDQVFNKLKEIFSNDHAIGKFGKLNVEVHLLTDKSVPPACAHVVVTNIDQLVNVSRKSGKNASSQPDEPLDRLEMTKHATEMMKNLKPALVIVDEGHHSPADKWQLVKTSAQVENPSCKILFLTATPKRGDGRSYGLVNIPPPLERWYLYRRKEAEQAKYIKTTTAIGVPVEFSSSGAEKYDDKDYVLTMLRIAAKKLKELRISCGAGSVSDWKDPKKPLLRMLVTARTNSSAAKIAQIFNEEANVSSSTCSGLFAKSITASKMDTKNNYETKKKFECKDKQDGIVDVAVQCQMLGEGYDNPLIAISTFVFPAMSVRRLAQVHGCAIRKNNDINSNTYPQSLQSYLYYPKAGAEKRVNDVVDEYTTCQDEEEMDVYLFDDGDFHKSLKAANGTLAKKKCTEFVEELSDRKKFDEYHSMYAVQREEWDPIPAEQVAEELYTCEIEKATFTNFRIIDFGCGPGALFEDKMARLVHERQGNGTVSVLSLDVHELGAATLNDLNKITNVPQESMGADHTVFRCKSVAGDYTDLNLNDSKYFLDGNDCGADGGEEGERGGKGGGGGGALFDAGVFCLALMASDSLHLGLDAAAKAIKPGGMIYIVLSPWKVGLNDKQSSRKLNDYFNGNNCNWKCDFQAKTGFEVVSAKFFKKSCSSTFLYLQIKNMDILAETRKQLSFKLGNVTLKDLHQSDKQSVRAGGYIQEDAAETGDKDVAGSKRSAQADDFGGGSARPSKEKP